ncbi:MAG: hypothetical protein WEC37_03100 [Anaerolineales bacterium]
MVSEAGRTFAPRLEIDASLGANHQDVILRRTILLDKGHDIRGPLEATIGLDDAGVRAGLPGKKGSGDQACG